MVIAQNRIRRLKPRVMILLGADKRPNAYPPSLDPHLLYDPPATGEPYAIQRALPPGSLWRGAFGFTWHESPAPQLVRPFRPCAG